MNLGTSNGWDAAFVLSLTTAPQPPSFRTQPSPKILYLGSTAVFSAAVGGTPPLHFQWQTNGVNLSDGGNITGSGTNTLIIRNVGAERRQLLRAGRDQ